jgi:protein-S-isoprenylcysteine O-methyltransferase Ste14
LADPEKAAALRVELAKIAAEQESAAAAAAAAALAAQLTDVANARALTVQLAQSGSRIAWGAPVVSVVVLVTFGITMIMALTRSLPAGAEPVLNVLMGTLGAMATSVVGYWVGSSAGSDRKDEHLVSLANRN